MSAHPSAPATTTTQVDLEAIRKLPRIWTRMSQSELYDFFNHDLRSLLSLASTLQRERDEAQEAWSVMQRTHAADLRYNGELSGELKQLRSEIEMALDSGERLLRGRDEAEAREKELASRLEAMSGVVEAAAVVDYEAANGGRISKHAEEMLAEALRVYRARASRTPTDHAPTDTAPTQEEGK